MSGSPWINWKRARSCIESFFLTTPTGDQKIKEPNEKVEERTHPLQSGYSIRPACEDDLAAVQELLRPFVEQRKILRRTRLETTALLHTGFVAVYDSKVVGFSSVEIYSKKLSEIQCLVVNDDHQGKGLGGHLVSYCVELARQRGVMEVMAISSSEKFLQDLGFDYSLPNQKRALFYQLRSRDEVYRELEAAGED